MRDSEDDVVGTLADVLGARVTTDRGIHGYAVTHNLATSAGDSIARVLAGGSHADPHVIASGVRTPEVVDAIRGHWPEHHAVSRVDVAEDFRDPGAWSRLCMVALDVAEDHRLRHSTAGDWLGSNAGEYGRTLYLGAPTSAMRHRVYEKGRQMAGEYEALGLPVEPDWSRSESQLRVPRHLRERAASMSPLEVATSTKWSTDLWGRIQGAGLERYELPSAYRGADEARRLHYLVRQYGPTLERLAERLGGDWARVGEYLRLRIEGSTEDADER